MPNVEIQVMPTVRADHPGTAGLIEVLKFGDGTAVGRSDGDFNGRPVSEVTEGPHLAFAPRAWAGFVAYACEG